MESEFKVIKMAHIIWITDYKADSCGDISGIIQLSCTKVRINKLDLNSII